MVLITVELLGRSINQAKRRKEETLQRYLRRVTHVYLNNKRIERIVSLNLDFEYVFLSTFYYLVNCRVFSFSVLYKLSSA